MFKSVVFAVTALFLSACLPKPEPPVLAQLGVPTVKLNGEQEVTSEGLTVTLTPIAEDNAKDLPQIEKVLRWKRTTATGGSVQTQNMMATTRILPLPAFQVRIANNTGHVIRLTTAIFRLENNVGKKWQTFGSIEELGAWNMSMLNQAGVDPSELGVLYQQEAAALGGLQMLTRSVELLKGDEWVGYLAFNFGSTSYEELMNNTERFTLRLAEIPIETNDAGQVTKTTEFTFTLDKATVQAAVVCPAGTKEPSWANGCKRQ